MLTNVTFGKCYFKSQIHTGKYFKHILTIVFLYITSIGGLIVMNLKTMQNLKN